MWLALSMVWAGGAWAVTSPTFCNPTAGIPSCLNMHGSSLDVVRAECEGTAGLQASHTIDCLLLARLRFVHWRCPPLGWDDAIQNLVTVRTVPNV